MADQRQDTRTSTSSANSSYPHNKVHETWSGHRFEYDDTPGAERWLLRHSKGSYVEVRPDGGMNIFAVGDTKLYHKAGLSMTVDENGDVKMTGHARFIVGGGAHIEVAGDAGVAVGGTMAAVVMGDANIRAKTAYVGTDGNMNLNVGGNMDMKVKGDTTMTTEGTHTIKAAKITMNP